MTRVAPLLAASIFCVALAFAADQKVFEKPSTFIRNAFSGGVPAARSLTLTPSMEKDVKKILGHSYRGGSRFTYWASGKRSVWILEEIGKTLPITTGFIVDGGALTSLKVLVYRESHGWEVEKPFFTRQFKGATLGDGGALSKRIDGISGATLSVRALTKLSALALYLHSKTAGG